MKMFEIERKIINGAPPGHFPNELHEFTFNTQKMQMGFEKGGPSQKEEREALGEKLKKK